jgi:hypothetical protein
MNIGTQLGIRHDAPPMRSTLRNKVSNNRAMAVVASPPRRVRRAARVGEMTVSRPIGAVFSTRSLALA